MISSTSSSVDKAEEEVTSNSTSEAAEVASKDKAVTMVITNTTRSKPVRYFRTQM